MPTLLLAPPHAPLYAPPIAPPPPAPAVKPTDDLDADPPPVELVLRAVGVLALGVSLVVAGLFLLLLEAVLFVGLFDWSGTA